MLYDGIMASILTLLHFLIMWAVNRTACLMNSFTIKTGVLFKEFLIQGFCDFLSSLAYDEQLLTSENARATLAHTCCCSTSLSRTKYLSCSRKNILTQLNKKFP